MLKRTLTCLLFISILFPTALISQNSQIGLSLNSPKFLDGNSIAPTYTPFQGNFRSLGLGITYSRTLAQKLFAEASLHSFIYFYAPQGINLIIDPSRGKISYRSGLLLNYAVGGELVAKKNMQVRASGGFSFRYSEEEIFLGSSGGESYSAFIRYLGPGLNAGLSFQYRIFKPLYFTADAKLHHFFSYQPKSREQQIYHTRNTIHILNLSAGLAIRFGKKGSITED